MSKLNIDRETVTELLLGEDFTEIYEMAEVARQENVGNEIHYRAIIEFSNVCKRNCTYCGLNCQNREIARYRMTKREILRAAEKAIREGYRTIVLQSGEDDYYNKEKLGKIIEEIKEMTFPQRCPNCRTVAAVKPAVTLSVGERPFEDYAYWRQKGADRYLLKHETANRKLYAELHPDATFENRVRCLKHLKQLGYETGSGFMVGLPKQTATDLAENLLLLKELQCDMAGIGPYIYNPKCKDAPKPQDTDKLASSRFDAQEMTKRCIAIARLLLPKINLPVTTAARVLGENELEGGRYGANVIMNKFTPEKYKEAYEIYPK